MMTADTPTPVARDAAPAGSWEPATRPFNLAARLPAGTRSFRTIESHTAGNPTRTVLSGVPELSGATMLERMGDLAAHHDWVRSALMFEPRGGPVMSGCVLQAPTDPRADIGVLFIEASGHLPMCGHDTIGLVTVLLEAGLVEAGPVTPVVLDTPAGLVETEAVLRDGHRDRAVDHRPARPAAPRVPGALSRVAGMIPDADRHPYLANEGNS